MSVVGREVPDRCVKLAAADVIEALYYAITAVTGRAPAACELCCHVAQSALETGHWEACHRNNLGNIKAAASYTGDITYFGCNEVLGGKVKWFHPDPSHAWPGQDDWVRRHPNSTVNDSQCRWRAYETLEQGATAQMQFFQKRPRSYQAAKSGNPRTFAHALKLDRYYTAHEEDYYAGGKLQMGYGSILESVFNRYLPACEAACKALAEAKRTPIPTPEFLPMVQDPEVDRPRAEALSQEHVDLVAETLADLVIEIPRSDIAAHNRRLIADM